MAKGITEKNGKKKTLKRAVQIETNEISEIVKCYLLEYKTAETPMLIYKKVSDSTIHGAWIHPETDLKYMKKIIKRKEEDPWRTHVWISLCKGFLESEIGKSDQFFIRHVVESLSDIKEIPKSVMSTEEAVMLAVQSVQLSSLKA
jgi:hypothetical protein